MPTSPTPYRPAGDPLRESHRGAPRL